jgi:hypothetical protein
MDNLIERLLNIRAVLSLYQVEVNSMEDLEWKPVIRDVERARNQFVPDMWPTTGRQIVERLCRHYGIDVSDRRQLNYLMQSMGLFTSALASTALDLDGSLVLQP